MDEKVKAPNVANIEGNEMETDITGSEYKDSKNSVTIKVPPFEKSAFEELIGLVKPNKIYTGGIIKDKGDLYASICQDLMEVCTANGMHIASTDLGIFEYDGKKWVKREERFVKDSLTEISLKMGVAKANQFRFRNDLVQQFDATFSTNWNDDANGDRVRINLENGTFDVLSNQLLPHDPSDHFLYCLPYPYVPNATCDLFLKYMEQVLPDEESRRAVLEFMGYCLLRGLKLERCLALIGSGHNGKSVLLEIVQNLFGDANVSNVTMRDLCSSNSYFLMKLITPLVNISSENNPEAVDSSIFKTLASNEPFTAREPYGKPIEVKNYAKLIFSFNKLPISNDQSLGYYRRYLLIPFKQTISEEKKDVDLAKKIVASELPGIFNLVLESAKRVFQQRGFSKCEAADVEMLNYRRNSDNVMSFAADNQITPGRDDSQSLSDMYARYREYCKDSGFSPCSKNSFADRLRGAGISVEAGAHNVTTVFFAKTEDNVPF